MLVQGPTAEAQQSLLIFFQVDVNFINWKASHFEPLSFGDGQIQHLQVYITKITKINVI